MSLASLLFIAFLAVVTLIYYLLPGKGQWVWLLLAGLVFYGLCSYALVIVPIAVALLAWGFAKLLEKNQSTGIFVLELILLVGILFVFKYDSWLGEGWTGFLLQLGLGQISKYAVPLGISYYTIMAIAYSIDVKRGLIEAEKNPAKVLLYLTFFPITTQGPICRYPELKEQLFTRHKFSYENLTFGAQRMLWGFFKKLVIAERLHMVSAALSAGWGETPYGGAWVLLGIAVFSLRIYMDFSGCMDIALGAAEILGIRLPENFDHPYLARSIPEFWRKWHITLGTWLRDYVMYSFTMSRPAKAFTKAAKDKKGRKRAALIINCIGILLVWFVYAIWHDLSFTFLFGGAYYGVIILLSTLFDTPFKNFRKRYPKLTDSKPYHVFQVVRSMCLHMTGALFFFMPTVKDGLSYLSKIFCVPEGALVEVSGPALADIRVLGLELLDAIVLVLAFAFWIFVSRLDAKKDPRKRLAAMVLPARWAILIVLVIAVVLFGKYGSLDAGSFVYQAF